MSEKQSVTLIKSANFLIVHPNGSYGTKLIKDLAPYLQYQAMQKQSGRRWDKPQYVIKRVYDVDSHGRLCTGWGYARLVRKVLREFGCEVEFRDETIIKDRSVYKPDLSVLDEYTYRGNQRELLERLSNWSCGLIDCSTGYGKSFVIGAMCRLFPKARIHIVTRSLQVLKSRLYPELSQMIGRCGMVGDGMNDQSCRVTCVSAASMHKVEPNADILIADEVHELGYEKAVGALARYQDSRNFGFTASTDARADGADFELQGLFGPVIFKVTYREAIDGGNVVPIKIVWTEVQGDDIIRENDPMSVKMSKGIWKNFFRNRLIAKDAAGYDDDRQVLITCQTLEHAVHLKKLLPNFELMYNPASMRADRLNSFVKAGLLPSSYKPLTAEDRHRKTKEFELGQLKKVICTTIWNVGVSFDKLDVLVRAEGTSSKILDIQVPGRVSRISHGKEFGLVHDYKDQFNEGFMRRSKSRYRSYKSQGWEQTGW